MEFNFKLCLRSFWDNTWERVTYPSLKSRREARALDNPVKESLLFSIKPYFIPPLPTYHNLWLFPRSLQEECKHIMADSLLNCLLLYSQCLAYSRCPINNCPMNGWDSIRESYHKVLTKRNSSSPCTCPVSSNALSQGNHF